MRVFTAISLFALSGCAARTSANEGTASVVTVRADLRLQAPQQGGATSQRIAFSRGGRGGAVSVSDAGAPRVARSRCYADDERHPQDVVDVSSGRWHSCVVLRDGSVRCWGWNYDGQLGDGTRGGHNAPIVVQGVRDVAEVRAGWDFTCARTRAGAAYCWGENDYGQVGSGDRRNVDEPLAVRGLSDARQIVVGATHACALRSGGAISCWGRNEFGEVGDGSTALRDRPVSTRFPRALTEVAAGDGASCALREDGSVHCAGWLARSPTPAAIESLGLGITDVALGKNYACATSLDGSVRCWGEGFVGQLGAENVGEVFVPRALTGVDHVAQMALGARGGCAVRTDGQLWCWGRVGASARRGEGGAVVGRAPYRVDALEGVAQVSVGDDFVCARMTAGGVCCFGDNHMGQLGNNDTHAIDEGAPSPVRW